MILLYCCYIKITESSHIFDFENEQPVPVQIRSSQVPGPIRETFLFTEVAIYLTQSLTGPPIGHLRDDVLYYAELL